MAARTLVLLRHAKAESEGDLGDAKRPLSTRGRRQAGAVGTQLATEVGPIDLAIVSSALRTTETYRLLGEQLAVRSHEVREEVYAGGPRDVLDLLRGTAPEVGSVLVIGHEPTMSGTAYLLHDERDELAKQVSMGIPTASACILQVPHGWADLDRAGAHLTRILRPSE
ncbi:histidine phosphatase family protein [Georgenia halophila]|uniref:Histidine phosphatase family protein n=1 Tax=Georgenia halophila TaxID=620889 RepID=A0ABP8L6P3_9MICO